jgi:hypothetical protein
MSLSRREVLKLILGSGAVAAGWAITSSSTLASVLPTVSDKKIINKSLITLGVDVTRHPDVLLGKSIVVKKFGVDNCSIISEISMITGELRQSIIPVNKPHGALRLGNGNLLVTSHHGNKSALLDEDHTLIQQLYAPDGYLYGGHSIHIPEKSIIIVPVRYSNPVDRTGTGLLMVYDDQDFKFLDQYNSHGIHPHEIHLLPQRNEFVVSHYGNIETPDPEGFSYNILEPKLSILDSNDFSMKREYIQPIDAIFTHIDVGASMDVYAVSNQYIPYDDANLDKLKSIMEKHNMEYNHIIPALAKHDYRVPVPGGIIRVNSETGDREVFLTSDEDFLRSQSIAAHRKSRRIFATYVYSNNLIIIDEATKKVIVKDANDYGFRAIRGVANIPGTDFVAISDQERGVAIINAITLKKIKDFPVDILKSAHIFAI